MTVLFLFIPALAKIFSNNSLTMRLVIIAQLSYFFITRKIFRITKDFKLKIVYSQKEIIMYLKYPDDIGVLKEIYLNKEYEWVGNDEPLIIIDIGAHFGDTALYYWARFPNALIVAVEPSPENYNRLVKHVKNIATIIPVNIAVGGSEGEIKFNIGGGSLGHSINIRKDSKEVITVPQTTLKNLLHANNILKADLIKFDIEGAEFDVFKEINPGDFSDAYIGELHFDLNSSITKEDFIKLFSEFETELKSLKLNRYSFTALKICQK